MTEKSGAKTELSGYSRNEAMIFNRIQNLENIASQLVRENAEQQTLINLLMEHLFKGVPPPNAPHAASQGSTAISRPPSNSLNGPLSHKLVSAMLSNLNSTGLEPSRDSATINNPAWWEAYQKAQRMRLIVILVTCVLVVMVLFLLLFRG